MQSGLEPFDNNDVDFSDAMFYSERGTIVNVYPDEYKVDVELLVGSFLKKLPVLSNGGFHNDKFQGIFDIPRVNDEVIVIFVQGHSESGFVISSAYFGDEPTEKVKEFLSDKAENDYVIQRGDIEFKIFGDESKAVLRKKDDSLIINVDLTNNKVVIDADNIEIGSGTLEKLIKSESFQTLFNNNVSTYNTHTHPGGGAPSGAMTTMGSSELSTKIKTE